MKIKNECSFKKNICPYCHFESGSEDPMKTFYTDGCELFIRKDNLLEVVPIDYYDDFSFKFDEKIKFCSMCGRRLDK